MKEQLEQIKAKALADLAAAADMSALDAVRVRVLGKKGELTALLKGMGQLAPEERPRVGAQINEVRQWLTERMDEAQARIRAAEVAKRQQAEASTRRNLLGSGDRSDRNRTYNFPQGRVTDHRINLTLYRLDEAMEGKLDMLIEPIVQEHQADQLAALSEQE